jgi:EAL domain-containing protein (putative c-di-GMP-specific phosphodiesterase class I)
MDDFGTGYSSLSYLRSFPFDKIKIDRSFVKDLAQRPDCGAIVRAISGLGRSLNITTTAEGVETEDQLDWLRAEGCNEVQGFLFSAARPAAEIGKLLADFGQRTSRAA